MEREALQRLAQQLKRPVMSFQEFSKLSDEQLDWLSQQVTRLCKREEDQLQQSFMSRMPDVLSHPEADKNKLR